MVPAVALLGTMAVSVDGRINSRTRERFALGSEHDRRLMDVLRERADAVLIGEMGLAGELRMPGQMQARLREAQKLGFKTAIVPKAIRKGEGYPKGIEIVEVRSLDQALNAAFAVPAELPKGRKVA